MNWVFRLKTLSLWKKNWTENVNYCFWTLKINKNRDSWEEENKQGESATLGLCTEVHSGPRNRVKGSKQSPPQRAKGVELEGQRCWGGWKLWGQSSGEESSRIAIKATEIKWNHENTQLNQRRKERQKKQIQLIENRQQGGRLKSTI